MFLPPVLSHLTPLYENRNLWEYSLNVVMFVLTCCRNRCKVLEATPLISPEADQVKLEELEQVRFVKGEVEQRRRFVPCVIQSSFCQALPGASLVLAWDKEVLCCPIIHGSLSLVLDPKACNQPGAVVDLHCEALVFCLSLFCQPVVGLVIGMGVFFTKAEDIICLMTVCMVSAVDHLGS